MSDRDAMIGIRTTSGETVLARLPASSDPVLAFTGDDWYPEGGWNDYLGTYSSVAEAITAVEADCDAEHGEHDWGQIVSGGKIVAVYDGVERRDGKGVVHPPGWREVREDET